MKVIRNFTCKLCPICETEVEIEQGKQYTECWVCGKRVYRKNAGVEDNEDED